MTTRTEPLPDTPMNRRMAHGHEWRTGHELDAYLVFDLDDPNIGRIVRRCCEQENDDD
jgi:hypothetical protein